MRQTDVPWKLSKTCKNVHFYLDYPKHRFLRQEWRVRPTALMAQFYKNINSLFTHVFTDERNVYVQANMTGTIKIIVKDNEIR